MRRGDVAFHANAQKVVQTLSSRSWQKVRTDLRDNRKKLVPTMATNAECAWLLERDRKQIWLEYYAMPRATL